MKPYLFLDVDGVLNRVPNRKRKDSGAWPDFKKFKLRPFNQDYTYNLFMSAQMATALAELPVEIVWLTTWCEEAPRLVAPCIGLPEYPVAGFGSDLSGRKTSKLGCILEWLQEHGTRSFVWIDDDAIPSHAKEYFDDQGCATLMIAPDPYEAVTPDDIERIKLFCSALAIEDPSFY